MVYRAYAVDQRIVSRDTALAYWALLAHVAMLVCLIRNAMDGPPALHQVPGARGPDRWCLPLT